MSEEPPIVAGPVKNPTNPQTELSQSPPESKEESTAEPNPLIEIRQQLSALGTEIQSLNELARAREQNITRLHDEVQQLRRGELTQAVAPLIRDLIHLHDQLASEVGRREKAEDADGIKIFAFYCEEVLEILARYDVEKFGFVNGEKFNPTEQRAVSSVPVQDAALDYRIAVMRRPGFRSGGRIVRYADVEVFRHESPSSRTDTNP